MRVCLPYKDPSVSPEPGNLIQYPESKKEIEYYEQWVEFFPDKRQSLRDFFFAAYQHFAEVSSARYIHRCLPYRSLIDPDDIRQQANCGLLEAIQSFDPYRGVSFKTHSFPRINGSIIDGLRTLQDFPRFVAKVKRRLAPLIQQLQQRLQHSPSVEDLILYFPNFEVDGVSIGNLIHDRLITVNVYNQHEAIQDSDNPESFIDDLIDIVHDTQHYVIQQPEFVLNRVDLIGYILHNLQDGIEQQVILMYYFGGKTLTHISKILNLSIACVSAKKISAIDNLRRVTKTSNELWSLINERE